ncbi:uncharacterized protein LOC110532798 [Oncorhynchus mykiss]|uniref:uncharacterized protein LOC110532798 n=1 Tax=Oncorhynchus mykiss TaxID=8022 RepID=UPI001878B8C6|nr:uncharacterized protein LOC110532798 [Oncorhynchus mykiss]
MKILFLLILLLDVPEMEAQQRMVVNGQVLLRFVFPPFYNGYEKFCSKLYPWGVSVIVNTRGYVNDFYEGRVSTTEYNGGMDVVIWNLKPVDTGNYRCAIVTIGWNHIYKDYNLQIDSGRRSGPVSPRPPVRSTISPFIFSSSSDTSGPVFTKDHSDSPSVPWSFGLPLAAGLCIAMVIVISSVVLVVVHHKIITKKKCGATSSDSAAHILSDVLQEENSIVYTTVDFKPHENHTTELYANLQTLRSPRSTDSHREPAGTVVYSTLASNQR